MQKIVLLTGVLLLFAFAENNSGPFTVSGTLKNSPSKVVYLEESNIATGQIIKLILSQNPQPTGCWDQLKPG